jgi:hypothetical protein
VKLLVFIAFSAFDCDGETLKVKSLAIDRRIFRVWLPRGRVASAKQADDEGGGEDALIHGQMVRDGHELPKVSLRPAMPYPSTAGGLRSSLGPPSPYAYASMPRFFASRISFQFRLRPPESMGLSLTVVRFRRFWGFYLWRGWRYWPCWRA